MFLVSLKIGGDLYPTWLVDGFEKVIFQCDLCDIEMCGHPFISKKKSRCSQVD